MPLRQQRYVNFYYARSVSIANALMLLFYIIGHLTSVSLYLDHLSTLSPLFLPFHRNVKMQWQPIFVTLLRRHSNVASSALSLISILSIHRTPHSPKAHSVPSSLIFLEGMQLPTLPSLLPFTLPLDVPP